MLSALVLIDIQNDYFPGGRWELDQSERAARQAGRALEVFRSGNLPVFHIRHVSKGTRYFLPDTFGAEIHPLVAPAEGETVLVKHEPNSFSNTGLEEALRRIGADQLVVCGMMSHMCVDTTVRAAKENGYSVVLLEDACTTRDLSWDGERIPARTVHRAFMAALDGTFAKVIRTEDFLAEMRG